MSLQTDWLKVATSGKTADGREITEQDLLDMAETYNPDEYSATIWDNHYRYWKFGKVLSVKAEKDDKGRVCLFAKLKPNSYYIEANKNGQLEHFSIEILPNFAGTDKAYLGGLAITDNPASLGTSAAQLYSANQDNKRVFSEPLQFKQPVETNIDEAPAETLGLLNQLKKLFSNEQPEANDMSEKTLSEILEKFNSIEEKLDSQAQQIQSMSDSNAQDGDAPDESESKQFSALQSNFEKLEQKFNALEKDHEALKKKFNKASSEPLGDDGDDDEVIETENFTC